MEENRFAHGASAGAAGDGYAPLLLNNAPGAAPPPGQDEDEHAFASEAEENAYWQGVADGIRNEGGKVPPRLAARAAKGQLLVQMDGEEAVLPELVSGRGTMRSMVEGPPAAAGGMARSSAPCDRGPSTTGSAGNPPPSAPPGEDPTDILHFTPADLRARHDGWTPQKQREFVEALADTGIVRAAAARVGMTEQGANRLRRRADARGFDRACEAALRLGARRLVSIAYERAIEGTIKRHYFHGELKAEERVYDNRLLIALINKLPADALAPTPETQEVAANWEPWMEAIEQGRDPPAPPVPGQPAPAPPTPGEPADAEQSDAGQSDAGEPFEASVWEDEGDLLTDAPPPAGFDLHQHGRPGEPFYQRRLTAAEEQWWDEEGEGMAEEEYCWGHITHYLGRPTFFPWGSEPSEHSEPSAPAQEARERRGAAGEPARNGPPDGAGADPAAPDPPEETS